MAKQIIFTYEKTDYTLEVSREAIKRFEKNGFNINDLGAKVLNSMETLFHLSLYKNHPFIKEKQASQMLEAVGVGHDNPLEVQLELVKELVEMYQEALNTLSTTKKATWKAMN